MPSSSRRAAGGGIDRGREGGRGGSGSDVEGPEGDARVGDVGVSRFAEAGRAALALPLKHGAAAARLGCWREGEEKATGGTKNSFAIALIQKKHRDDPSNWKIAIKA